MVSSGQMLEVSAVRVDVDEAVWHVVHGSVAPSLVGQSVKLA
jgi:hypothetical protein